jgi:hypothetical protein
MVVLHEEQLRVFVKSWRAALAAGVQLAASEDPNYASLETLGRHVLSAAGGYLIWICKVLPLADPGVRAAPDVSAIVDAANVYLEHVLERWRGDSLKQIADEQMETPEYDSGWRTKYCIDSMLEHAVMHPMRHTFQLNELMKGR